MTTWLVVSYIYVFVFVYGIGRVCCHSFFTEMDPVNFMEFKWVNALFRTVCFILYLSFAIYFIAIHDQGECSVAHTYQSELASSVVSNPMYTSTQVWRNYPSPNTAGGNTSVFGKQRTGDIAVFPVVMGDPIKNAAFLQLDNLVGNMMGDSVLPNGPRCIRMKVGQDGTEQYEKEVSVFASNSYYRGTCALTGLHQKVDVQTNFQLSLVPFSSVSRFFIPHIVFWIAASFQLNLVLYRSEWDVINWVTFGVATIWNVIGICIAVAFAVESKIPVNNALIAIIMYLLTIYMQMKWKMRRGSWSQFYSELSENPQSSMTPSQRSKIRIRVPKTGSGSDLQRKYGSDKKSQEFHSLFLTFESMEHVITAPLVITYLVATVSTQMVPTASLQILFLLVLVGRIFCATMFRIQQMRCACQEISRNLFECLVMLFVMTAALLAVYFYVALSFFPRDASGLIAVLVMEYMYTFAVGFIVFSEFVFEFKQTFIMFLTFIPAFADFVMKIIIIGYMFGISGDRFGCRIWPHLFDDSMMTLKHLLATM